MPLAGTIVLISLTQTPAPGPVQVPAASSQPGPVVDDPPTPGSVQVPAASSRPAPVVDDPPTPDAPRIAVAILRADDLDLAALARAIQLRSPALTLVTAGDDAPPAADGELRAYIEVRRSDPHHVDLTLILADGRAYLRRIDVDEAPARPIAGALANLIAGIEDDTVAPDRKDAPVPPALVAPAPATPVKPATSPPDDPGLPVTPPPVRPAAPEPPRWQIGPTLRLGATFGLSPPEPGFHGLGPGGGLDVRSPRGLLLALDLQWLARPLGAYFLARTRIALGVGYALRRGNFELPVALLFGVEPWRLRDDRGTVPLASTDGLPRPLLGGGVRLSPGLRAAIGRSTRLRVGLRLDLWTSGQPTRDGLRRPELRLPEGPGVGLGGAELHLGLEVGLWFGVGKPRAARK